MSTYEKAFDSKQHQIILAILLEIDKKHWGDLFPAFKAIKKKEEDLAGEIIQQNPSCLLESYRLTDRMFIEYAINHECSDEFALKVLNANSFLVDPLDKNCSKAILCCLYCTPSPRKLALAINIMRLCPERAPYTSPYDWPSPLEAAIIQGHKDFVSELIEEFPDVLLVPKYQQGPLYTALISPNKQADLITFLAQKAPDLLSRPSKAGDLPLHRVLGWIKINMRGDFTEKNEQKQKEQWDLTKLFLSLKPDTLFFLSETLWIKPPICSLVDTHLIPIPQSGSREVLVQTRAFKCPLQVLQAAIQGLSQASEISPEAIWVTSGAGWLTEFLKAATVSEFVWSEFVKAGLLELLNIIWRHSSEEVHMEGRKALSKLSYAEEWEYFSEAKNIINYSKQKSPFK